MFGHLAYLEIRDHRYHSLGHLVLLQDLIGNFHIGKDYKFLQQPNNVLELLLPPVFFRKQIVVIHIFYEVRQHQVLDPPVEIGDLLMEPSPLRNDKTPVDFSMDLLVPTNLLDVFKANGMQVLVEIHLVFEHDEEVCFEAVLELNLLKH